MDINEILNEYDSLFGKCNLSDIEKYLVDKIEMAKAENRSDILISLLNEIVGFCRDTTQKEKGIAYCDELLKLLNVMGLDGSVEFATSLLNIANAYRAFGRFEDSLRLYEKVFVTYSEKIDPFDFRFAGLYNNKSLLYQEMEDFEKAKDMLFKALEIVDSYKEAVIPQAITRTNLATALLHLDSHKYYEEAVSYLREALDVFETDGGKDFHYSAALVAMGDAFYFKKDFEKSRSYYEAGLHEIEKHTGKNENYYRVKEKLDNLSGDGRNNLQLCEAFYRNKVAELIKEKFSEYENRIAVGMVGEGSDCFGFDDSISKDHDYGIGLCFWLTQEDYVLIGDKLQKEYEKITNNTNLLQKRRGVFTINGFYNYLLGTENDWESRADYSFGEIEEYKLAAATNGKVFRDDLGVFERTRKQLLSYYPEDIFRCRLAQAVHEFSQYAQSNYVRMMDREDKITAALCVAKGIETAMDIIYLLNKKYAPYYKWKNKGMKGLKGAGSILKLADNILTSYTDKEKTVKLFDDMAQVLLNEMNAQNLVSGQEIFLEVYVGSLLKGSNMNVIDEIVNLEWKQFDKVKNEGGRADCQDDFKTFSVMRKSQYLTWDENLLNSYYNDLLVAESKGRNLIMEKYARMMESTAPDKFEEFQKELPELSKERIAIQEEIIKIQVAWMEAFAKEYPKMAENARSIRTEEDSEYNTSYETYLRGELSTYSDETFVLYGKFVTAIYYAGKNLAYDTMNNSAKFYGYESIDEAESKI